MHGLDKNYNCNTITERLIHFTSHAISIEHLFILITFGILNWICSKQICFLICIRCRLGYLCSSTIILVLTSKLHFNTYLALNKYCTFYKLVIHCEAHTPESGTCTWSLFTCIYLQHQVIAVVSLTWFLSCARTAVAHVSLML